MMNLLAAVLLGFAGNASADSYTSRLNLTIPVVGTYNWGPKVNNDLFSIDTQCASMFVSNTFISSNTFLAKLLASNTSFTLTGPEGWLTSVSSINASGFFGDGAGLTGIVASGLADGAVTTNKLASGAVTTSKLHTDAVTEYSVLNGAITTNKLGSGSVTTSKLNTDAVSSGAILASAVTEVKINDGAVTTNKLGAGAVTTSKLNTDSVSSGAILAGSVTTDKLGAASVIEAKLAGGSVTSSKLGSGAVDTPNFASGATAPKATELAADPTDCTNQFANGIAASGNLSCASVAEAYIAAGSVTTDKLGSGAVTVGKVNFNYAASASAAGPASSVADGIVTTDKLGSGAVTTSKLAVDAVVSGSILAGAVTTTKLGTDSVSESKILAGSVTTDKLGSGSVTTSKLGLDSVTNLSLISDSASLSKVSGGAATSDGSKLTATGAVDVLGPATFTSTVTIRTPVAAGLYSLFVDNSGASGGIYIRNGYGTAPDPGYESLVMMNVTGASPMHSFWADGRAALAQDTMFGTVGVRVSSPALDVALDVGGPAQFGSGSIKSTFTASGLTIGGNTFTVGGSTIACTGGKCGIGATSTHGTLTVHRTASDTISNANSSAWFGDRTANVGATFQQTLSSPYGFAIQALDNVTAVPLLLNPSGGNVGIGTVNPAAKLHVSSGTLLIDGGAANSFRVGASSMIFTSESKLGINTQLSWLTPFYSQVVIASTDNNKAATLSLWELNQGRWDIGMKDGQTALTISDSVGNAHHGSPHMTLLTSGNVGIGTTNPGAKLDVLTTASSTGTIVTGAASQTADLQQWVLNGPTVAVRITAAGGVVHASKAKADFDALVPSVIGEEFRCSDCTVKNVCISTGTAVAQWMRMDLATAGCGSGE
jgi:hypothetical protein